MEIDIERRLRVFGLHGSDLTTLREAQAMIVDELDGVMDRFYGRLKAGEEAKYFQGEAHMSRARSAQKRHWELLLSGRFDANYRASVSRVGRAHIMIQLPFAEYIGAYSRVSTEINALLIKKMCASGDAEDLERCAAYSSVICRAFFMDIELVINAIWQEETSEQKAAFTHLEAGIQRLAECDLVYRIPGPQESDFPERYEPLRVALNTAIAHLHDVLAAVTDTMENLRTVAYEVADATASLAQRTEAQAVALEETTASVQQVTETVARSTESTEAAHKVAQGARGSAQTGQELVDAAAGAMGKIETSAKEISQIVSLINDVAFQTNLLALNAGVEAARAGDAGRGFAVVASEVRSLSERSTEAVKKIEALIDTSSLNVKSGVDLVGQVAGAIETIVNDFTQVTVLATEIATASTSQSDSLSEINTAVSQLDRMTQQNAAMVEETTAAGEILRQSTDRLAEIVGAFVLQAEGRASREEWDEATRDRNRKASGWQEDEDYHGPRVRRIRSSG